MACLLVIFWITSYAWPHPNYDADLISRNYGSQVTERCLEFENTVYGLLPTEHSARLLQLNGFVTAGVTPSGNTNGYHRVFSREIKVATGTMYFTTGPELYTERSERQVRGTTLNY
ncbi:hypothetical protein C8R43DRAFT_27964 [Mycena crocata]|nr:hypothetical protein C8R43DRAFT_27964 [Mycena crocata]